MVAGSLGMAENRQALDSNLLQNRAAEEDRYLRVGNLRTRYRAAGEAGPPLILIHGLGASLESWHLNLEALGRHHRVFAPDLVWFGKSDKPAREVTSDFFAEFIVRFMDAVGVLRATLVGNSMGGMVAVKTALEYPQRVKGLVLVSPAGFGRELAWWLRLRTLVTPDRYLHHTLSSARYVSRFLVHDPTVLTDAFLQMTLDIAGQPGGSEAYGRVLRFGADWRGLKAALLREVRAAAHYLTRRPGGGGAVREAVELLLKAQGQWRTAVEGWR